MVIEGEVGHEEVSVPPSNSRLFINESNPKHSQDGHEESHEGRNTVKGMKKGMKK